MRRDLGDGYELDDDRTRIDRDAVHAYLGGVSYWAKGRTREQQDALIDASGHVVGLYTDGRQVGFARAVDCVGAGFVYLADVYVLDEHRGRGLGVELVREIVENGPYADRRWVLHTQDAHTLYEKLGFGPNERLMERRGQPAGVNAAKLSVPCSQTERRRADRRIDGAAAVGRHPEDVGDRLARCRSAASPVPVTSGEKRALGRRSSPACSDHGLRRSLMRAGTARMCVGSAPPLLSSSIPPGVPDTVHAALDVFVSDERVRDRACAALPSSTSKLPFRSAPLHGRPTPTGSTRRRLRRRDRLHGRHRLRHGDRLRRPATGRDRRERRRR